MTMKGESKALPVSLDVANIYGDGKITAADLDALAPQMRKAHQAVEHMRQTGEVRGHLSKDGAPEKVLFTQLPHIASGHLNSPESIGRLKAFGASLRGRVDTVVSFGIGGSFLGNKVLFDLHCGEFWNLRSTAERNGWPRLYFSGNNLDPQRTGELIDQLGREAAQKARDAGDHVYRVLLVVISKSGSTIETTGTFMSVYAALRKLPTVSVEVAAVTDPAEGANETLLHRLARMNKWPMFSVPDGVGGRFSVFAEVGLITGACIGFDIEAFLDGARQMDEACRSDDPWKNPALLNAALKYLSAKQYGRHIEVFMPYADSLKSVAEWYIQLLAESLGKRSDRSGRTAFYGRTPVVAVGTTDMHAQTQQHQDGAHNKVVQFVKVGDWGNDLAIPALFASEPALEKLAGISLGAALEAARESNAEALAGDNRFNAAFVLAKRDACSVGALMYLLALSVAYEGELADVDAFDQPGVEAYKRLMGPKLAALKQK